MQAKRVTYASRFGIGVTSACMTLRPQAVVSNVEPVSEVKVESIPTSLMNETWERFLAPGMLTSIWLLTPYGNLCHHLE